MSTSDTSPGSSGEQAPLGKPSQAEGDVGDDDVTAENDGD